jgi:hypothetical protein
MQKIVQRMRKEIGLPSYFTLDACRHGGMTELKQTRKRRAHRVANQAAASIQNEAGDVIQNGNGGLSKKGIDSKTKSWLGREGSNLRMAESKCAA